ncbi:uncharacterized protein APUU_21991S [Aspergillus puulaauensis]|uniref:Uncharacterized protein n=1 Tax=Aspergillus puulaauensis TaxID=1220207 RepID=A0A7R7XHW4_9EURO|nr:uncharacterized protein APUU_21991S [Aspergillus puulaauensis]BCS21559.1 hypothetical protein APUU_21991S [Aspergillus puulaauensis]
MASDWSTTTSDPILNVDENGRTVTTTVLVVSPPNGETAWSTWYIGPSATYESYTTWVDGKSTTEGSIISKQQQTTEQEQTTTEQTAVKPTPTSTGSTNDPSASSNSSTAETPDRQSSQPSGGISDGALAGAIVGSIVGTALVTLLLAFLFFRRRQSKPAKEVDDGAYAGAAARHRKSKSGSAFPLADIIPQPEPADDDTVRRRILTLVDQAGLHIDNYYVPGSMPAHLSAEQSARLAVYSSTELPAPIETLLAQREVRRQTLKYALVRTILRAIIPGGNGTGELLPRAFADMPVVEGRSGSSAAVFNWRMLTAHLHSQASNNTTPTTTTTNSNSNRNSKIQPSTTITEDSPIQATESLAGQFTAAFNPYSFPSFTPEERISHLETLACSAADLGVWLFSQPCAFEFDWKTPGTSAGGISVVPRVLKVADEKGAPLVTPQVLVEGERVAYTARI